VGNELITEGDIRRDGRKPTRKGGTVRYRTLLALTAPVLLAAALCSSAAADTAPPTTLYVDNLIDSGCNDTGPGTLAEPFCTIQHAADVALPGQTVDIGPNIDNVVFNEDVHVTKSGTPGQPITFEAGSPWYNGEPQTWVGTADSNRTEPNGFVLDNVHDVIIDGLGISDPTSTGIVVSNSSDISINHVYESLGRSITATDAIDVTGNSNDIAITRDELRAFQGTAVSVQPGASSVTVAENMLTGSNEAVVVNGASGTAITNNTINSSVSSCQPQYFQPPFSIAGDSTGTSIQNNVVTAACANPAPLVSVAADSVTGTVLDYNVIYDARDTAIYSWAGATYQSASALRASTGQGAHDSNARQIVQVDGSPAEGSPAIDSANANALGVLPTDYLGNVREDDTTVPNTGTGIGYIDRGAIELQDAMTLADTINGTHSSNVLHAPEGGTITLAMSTQRNWMPVAQYTVDFGDGTAPVTTTASTLTHVYATPNSYGITMTATDQLGATATTYDHVDVVPPAPLVPIITTPSTGPLTVEVDASQSTDSWTMLYVTCDFGDGSAPQTSGWGSDCAHTYAVSGTYPITATITDAGGNSQSAATQYIAS
jgi:hypothetical protein